MVFIVCGKRDIEKALKNDRIFFFSLWFGDR